MKTDCYFYNEEEDRITCNYYCASGYCPCTGCKKYVSKSDIYELVKDIVDTAERIEKEESYEYE